MHWQPIETAPRDGTVILAWGMFYGREGGVCVVSWRSTGMTRLVVETDSSEEIFGFCTGGGQPQGLTHWMPLPKGPEISKARGEACRGYFDPRKVYPR